MRALRRQPQDCADRARVPPSEPDYANMSLDDAAPQATKALVTAALPSITNCELTNVKGSLACSFYDSHCDFNCVIARIPRRTYLSTHQQHPAPAPASQPAGSEWRSSHLASLPSQQVWSELDSLVDTNPDTLPVGSVNVVAPRHAVPRGLVNLWRTCSTYRC